MFSALDASAMPLDLRHHRSIFTIRMQAFYGFAESFSCTRIIGIAIRCVQQHVRHIAR